MNISLSAVLVPPLYPVAKLEATAQHRHPDRGKGASENGLDKSSFQSLCRHFV